MRRRRSPLGLRSTVTLSFAAGALALSTVLALGTYLVARHYLIDQRERTAVSQAFADASYVRDGLLTSGARESDVLGSISASAGSEIVLHRSGQRFSSSLSEGDDGVPADVATHVAAGSTALGWTTTADGPAVAVGVPLPAVDAQFFEVAPATELARTLTTLATVLAVFAALTTVSGALLGRAASRRLVAPLDDIATAAAHIAVGRLDTRLPATDDPDLTVIVGSFNSMVEALDERIRRDARFAADLSHELRSPLTTLVASVEVMKGRRTELSDRNRQALDLVSTEVDRLHRSLEDLLELGRLDAGVVLQDLAVVDLRDLVDHALQSSRRSRDLLLPADGGDGRTGADAKRGGPWPVLIDKQRMNRALVNLFENADRHGGGLTAVTVRRDGPDALVLVDDRGAGVAEPDRRRIFERFVRAGSRGSRPGTGLGLSLVQESVLAVDGDVWCEEAPGGGARFVIRVSLHDHCDQLEAGSCAS